jgi:hypothetical protein
MMRPTVASPLAKCEKKRSICHAQAHMTCAEFGLWEQYRKLAHTSGQMFETTLNTAERFAGESRSSIYRLRSRLIDKGWLVVIKKAKRTKNGQLSSVVCRVMDHDQWTQNSKNIAKYPCKKPCPEMSKEALSPCPEMKSALPRNGIEPCPEMGSRFEEESGLKKKQIEDSASAPLSLNKTIKSDAEKNAKHVKSTPCPEMSKVRNLPCPEMSKASLPADPFPALAWDTHCKDWGARRGINRALTLDEITELQRRNRLRVLPSE